MSIWKPKPSIALRNSCVSYLCCPLTGEIQLPGPPFAYAAGGSTQARVVPCAAGVSNRNTCSHPRGPTTRPNPAHRFRWDVCGMGAETSCQRTDGRMHARRGGLPWARWWRGAHDAPACPFPLSRERISSYYLRQEANEAARPSRGARGGEVHCRASHRSMPTAPQSRSSPSTPAARFDAACARALPSHHHPVIPTPTMRTKRRCIASQSQACCCSICAPA
jgi:hypothetical protein